MSGTCATHCSRRSWADLVMTPDPPGIAWTATSVRHIVTAYLQHNKPIGPAATAQQVAPGGTICEQLPSR